MAKRRSRGEGTIFLDKSSGLWVAEITLPNGKKRRKYSKTQTVVKEWLLAQRNALKQGLLVESEKVTVSQFLDCYFTDVASHTVRPKTLESYEYIIRMHIKPEIGPIKLSALRPDHLQKLYSDKLNSGLSRRTVQYIHSVMHKSLDQALRWGLVQRNVADLVDAPSVKRKALNVWSVEQTKKFLDTVKDRRFYPIYVIAISCGMREGEILGLHYEDVDFENGLIHVRHAIQYLLGKGLVLTEPKTEKARRSIKMPDITLQALRQHYDKQKRNQGFIFITGNNTPISPRNLVRDFKSVLAETGLPDIRFYDLRHLCATLHLMAGTHPKTVQSLLGHSQINLTLDTYSHMLPVLEEEAAEKMNSILT